MVWTDRPAVSLPPGQRGVTNAEVSSGGGVPAPTSLNDMLFFKNNSTSG